MTVNERKRSSNRSGAVLLTVLTVACFAAVLLTAVISFVNRAHTNAYNNYNSEQAYYIASSALGSIHDYFETVDGDHSYKMLNDMANANGGAGSSGTLKLSDGTDAYNIDSVIPGGDCDVTVKRIGDDYIKVSVTGYCLGQAETINAYYSVAVNHNPTDIDNVLYCNGSSAFGQSAGSTGSLTTRGSYNVTNDASGFGSVVAGGDLIITTDYQWTDDPSAQSAGSYINVGHNFTIQNQYAHFNPTHPKVNDNTSQYLAVGGRLNARLDMIVGTGAAGGSNAYEMDVYCSNALFNDNIKYTQYGNFYCYKLSDEEWDEVHAHANGEACTLTKDNNGDVEFEKIGYCTINGDVFIEGDIIVHETNPDLFTINGTLYLDQDSEIVHLPATAGGTVEPNNMLRIICDKVSCPGPLSEIKILNYVKDKKLFIRKPGTTDTYYTYEELNDEDTGAAERAKCILHDPIVKGSSTSRNYKPSTKFEDYERVYPPTEDFIAQDPKIQNALDFADTCSIEKYAGSHHDAGLNKDFDYYIDGRYGNSCSITDSLISKTILIDMNEINNNCGTDEPFIIKLNADSGTFYFDNNCTIIIKNGEFDESQNKWVEPENFCYFITDDSSSGIRVWTMGLTVMDYYSYKYVVQNNYGINLTSYYANKNTDPTFENDIFATGGYFDGTQERGLYTPRPSRTYFMLREKDSYEARNIPEGFLEFILYAPKSTLDFSGLQGNLNLRFYKGNQIEAGKEKLESLALKGSCVMSVLGAIICDNFSGHETFGVGFVSPAPGSGVASGGADSTTTISFDHYESR